MSVAPEKPSNRLDPQVAWTVVTDSPLKGLSLAREAGTILAWDEGNQLYLYTVGGESQSYSRVPHKILAGSISDDGSLIALLVDSHVTELMLLNADFEAQSIKPAPSDASFLTIDSHGRFVAIATRFETTFFVNRHGRGAGRLESRGSFAHLCFVADSPLLVGAAAFGMLAGVALEPGRVQGAFDPEILWTDRLMSNVGRLTISGDGGMILASCYTLGIQRYDLRGRNEGSYHPGGTVSHAVPDFPGRTIAAATLEGDLAVLNPAGNVRWRTTLPRPLIALEIDALGRYLIHGNATGEITRLDLFGRPAGRSGAAKHRKPAAAPAPGKSAPPAQSAVRNPEWSVVAVQSEQQSETAVLAVTENPTRIALFVSPHRLHLYDASGKKIGQGPDLTGTGRILRTAPGWLAAATDSQMLIWNLKEEAPRRLDASLHQVTHLAIAPDDFGLAVIQERDRIGRLTVAGRWIWKHELRDAVEDLAIGPNGHAAVTTQAGSLQIFDPSGSTRPGFTGDRSDPPLLVAAPEGSIDDVTWITLTRRSQFLRGHDLTGEIVWESPLPWEPWSMISSSRWVIIAAADGRVLAYDGGGTIRAQGSASGDTSDVFSVDPDGTPVRISRRNMHLILAGLDGRVRWRSIADQPFGPIAAARPGIAQLIGKSLVWFQNEAAP